MSVLGQKQTSEHISSMSALPPIADIGTQSRNVRWRRHAHYLTAESAGVDAGVDFACSRERETVDHDGMNGAVAQQVEQCGHISLEIVGGRRSACSDAIENAGHAD